MEIRVSTVIENAATTLSAMYIDDVFECWVLEDAKQAVKIDGKTRIPAGRYPVEARKDSPMARRYDGKFKSVNHRGMLWLRGVPNFKWIYIHIGNGHDDTNGCLLVGDGVGRGAFGVASTITQSTDAYLRIYPMIMAAIDKEEPVFIEIDRDTKKSGKAQFVDGFVAGAQESLTVMKEFISMLESKGCDLKSVSKEMALDLWEQHQEIREW